MDTLFLGVLIIAVFVFCTIVIVRVAVRPSTSNLFVREFSSKNTESNEEIQERTSINWKKGGLRLTIVLSFLLGGIAGIISAKFYSSSADFSVGFLISFAMTWIIYFATRFVIRGFISKEES